MRKSSPTAATDRRGDLGGEVDAVGHVPGRRPRSEMSCGSCSSGCGWQSFHLLFGILLCMTIIGIPLGLGNFKLAAVAVVPLGKEIVRTSDPRAALGTVAF